LAYRRKGFRGVLRRRIGWQGFGIPIWAFALVVAIIGVAAGQAGSERVNALLAGFILMPGESRTVTFTNPTDRPASALGVLVTDTDVVVDAETDFVVTAGNVTLSDADQLLATMLQGTGGFSSPAKPDNLKPVVSPTAMPRSTPPPPSIAPESTRFATVNGKSFHVRVAADAYTRSTAFRNRAVIADDEAILFIHPQEGRWPYRTRDIMRSLDLLFLDRHFVIVDIQTTFVEPVGNSDDELHTYRPDAPAMYVMQIRGGLSDQSGIIVGAHISIR
jgi:uncharacterized membrane protein (UPF0127 family)